MQPNKLSLISLIAGVVMFLLPWVEVQCKGQSFIRQTGVQAAIGKATIAEEITKGAKLQQASDGKGPGLGFLIIASAAFALLALRAAWRAVQDDVHPPETIGRHASIAAALVGVQMFIGFPMERGLRDEMKKGMGGGAKDPLEAAMQQQVTSAFQVKYLPALYLYLAALGVPALQWLAGGRRRDSTEFESTTAPQ
jgi:hypothetical protein